jgi:hypothetical protein
LSDTNETLGTESCPGYLGPVQALRPHNLTAYQLAQGFNVTGNTSADISAGCSPTTSEQNYFGLLFFTTTDTSEPYSTSDMIYYRNILFILSAINAVTYALVAAGLAFTKGLKARFLGFFVGILCEFTEQFMLALFVCDLHETGFFCFNIPLGWYVMMNIISVGAPCLFGILALMYLGSAKCICSREEDDEDLVKEFASVWNPAFKMFNFAAILIPSFGFWAYVFDFMLSTLNPSYDTDSINNPFSSDDAYKFLAGKEQLAYGESYGTSGVSIAAWLGFLSPFAAIVRIVAGIWRSCEDGGEDNEDGESAIVGGVMSVLGLGHTAAV